MNITVKLTRTNETKKIELKQNSIVEDVLKKINIKPDTVIVMHKNKPIPITEQVEEGQELTILKVASGG